MELRNIVIHIPRGGTTRGVENAGGDTGATEAVVTIFCNP